METGRTATVERTVTSRDTAEALESGDVPALSTPRLVAWCEAATIAAIADGVGEARTSVGRRVMLEHLAASPVGQHLSITATVTSWDERKAGFDVVARHGAQAKVVARGEVTRVFVDRARFVARLSEADG